MGIPKFYRWTSERYPCLYEKIREYQIPEFDNLYLDMNGIIHNCSHPNDEDIHLRIPEENIFRDIFYYIDFLFRMIKPCKVFFMAVDGVAPRAKMNQQRGRRFRSARVAEEQEAEAIRQGEKLPNEDRFDSNCITPGTEFMARLHEQLKYFVSVKVSTDPLWQRKGLHIYLSGHDVPGEGEHKVMDFIRHIRSQPDYDPETRHCLYGLDADLMMLGLSTHELQFSLLREEVKFSRPKKKKPGNNQKKSKSKEKDDKGSILYDLTNVSVFSNENPMNSTSLSILPHPTNINPALHTSTADQTFADAVNKVPEPITGLIGNQPDPLIVGTEVDKANTDNAIPPPPPDEHGAKGDYKAPLPEKTTFFLLHLSLFRDYLDEEFKELKNRLENHPSIKFDLECLIDDWILMNILVGNDFVPHLPNLHIVKGALPMLYRTYMDVLPTLDGYLNENGYLNLKRFEVFIRKLSLFDLDMFRETYDDMKYKASKTGKNIVLGEKMFEDYLFEDSNFEEEDLEPISDELKALAKRTEDEIFGDINGDNGNGSMCKEVFPDDDDFFSPEDTEEFRLEFLQHKRNYYLTKCEFKKVDRGAVYEFAKEYVRAIQWVLLYYYKGVSSWGWFYPSHYAPFASDLRCFRDFKIEFNKGNPFRPFEQLLAVLPSQSKKLLPACYQWLMTEENSPILEYYPQKFELDLNGKKQDWEAVVLIPFIDESKLLTAMKNEAIKLTEEEIFRNLKGSLLCYSYTKADTGPVKSHRNLFPELEVSHIKLEKIDDVTYNSELLPKGLHPKANLKKIYQGFPSLKSKQFNSCICKAEVKVFEFYAREESLILSLEDYEEETDGLKLSKKILGKSVWVNWPHLESALVTAIFTRNAKYILGRDNLVIRDPKTTEDSAKKTFDAMAKGLVERHLKYRGINLGRLNVILYARVMEGRKMRCNSVGKVVIENQWSKVEQPYALKTAIYEERVTEMFYMDRETAKSYVDLYRKGDQVFYLGDKMFGAMGVVLGCDKGSGSVIVDLTIPERADESNLKLKTGLKQLKSQDYFPPYVAAAKCQISSFALSRLTGRVLVSVEKTKKPSKRMTRTVKNKELPESSSLSESDSETSPEEDFPPLEPEFLKLNIGLDLKFNKTNQEVRGYTSKRDTMWFYSLNAIKLVNEYASKFPAIVELLGRADKNKDVYNASEIFPDDPLGKTMEIVDWLEDRGVRNLPRIPTNCNVLDDDDIEVVWNHITSSKASTAPQPVKKWNVRPNLLYKPGLDKGCIAPIANSQFELLDRVVCVDRGASIPLGLRGTVVGIQAPPKNNNETSEEAFKVVSADALNLLIVMCDPVPDMFDAINAKTGKGEGDLTQLTGSLAKLLGVNDGGAPLKEQKVNHELRKPTTKPKLVKLFPYQVINLTQGAGDLRQDLKKKPTQSINYADKAPLRNGTVIVQSSTSKAQVMPPSQNGIKILQRSNPGLTKTKQEMPKIPSLLNMELPAKGNEPKVTLPWPPQPMNRSITVEQLFAHAAKAQQKPDIKQGLSYSDLVKGDASKTLSQSLKKPIAPVEGTGKTPKKATGQEAQKEQGTAGKKRQPAFAEKIMAIANSNSNNTQNHKSKGSTTMVFVNSALHSKGRSRSNNDRHESEDKLKQEKEVAARTTQSQNQLLNLLCQPKNMERVNTTSTEVPVVNDQQPVGQSGQSHLHQPPPQVMTARVPGVVQTGHSNATQFSHPVHFVPASHPQEYFVPTPYPVVMPGRNPYASAFMPQPIHYSMVPLQAMFVPPPPPQHWTQQSRNNSTNSANYHHSRHNHNHQSFRQMKGSNYSNIFVPTQVARSMALTDQPMDSNGSYKRKEVIETEKQPVVESVVFQPSVAEDTEVPASSTLKALLGVTTESQSESVPQNRKSRLAANFSFHQSS